MLRAVDAESRCCVADVGSEDCDVRDRSVGVRVGGSNGDGLRLAQTGD